MSNEKRLWIIEARDGAWGANGICKGELVRCKDCKFWHEVDTMDVLRYGECDRLGSAIRQDCFVNENWFCADGERRGQDDDTRESNRDIKSKL